MISQDNQEKIYCKETNQRVEVTSYIEKATVGDAKYPIEIRCSEQSSCEFYGKTEGCHYCPTMDLVVKRYMSQFKRKSS